MVARLALLVAVAAAPLSAQQRIKIAVDMTDSTGLFQSAFASAFRSLGDVELVTMREGPQYVLEGVVLCRDNCRDASAYVLALTLYEPMQRSTSEFLTSLARRGQPPPRTTRSDSMGPNERVWRTLRWYRKPINSWVMYWGRDRYERAVLEKVREIDSECLDVARALERAGAAGIESEAWAAYEALSSQKPWGC
jgi:hypothetical protein